MLASVATLLLCATGSYGACDVTGRVVMPAICAPEVNPAVVRLIPEDAKIAQAQPEVRAASVQLTVRQKLLQFIPRIQAARVGDSIRFTNEDQEAHNVHIQGPGVSFNQTIRPGETVEVTAKAPGLLNLLCDIHIHMRGYVWVSDHPWIAVCAPDGSFRLHDVPAGPYRLVVWHPMGESLTRELELSGAIDLGVLELKLPPSSPAAAGGTRVEPWPDVIDRVSVACAAALEIATSRAPNAATQAVRRVDEAYLGIFETSDMETAIGACLGYDRVIAVESRFRALRREARAVATAERPPQRFAALTRSLLSELVQAARDLQSLEVTDSARLSAYLAAPKSGRPTIANAAGGEDLSARLVALRRALDRVAALAETGARDEAVNEMVTAYFDAFEPLERVLFLRNPGAVRPLEVRFAVMRSDIEAGLSGADLDQALTKLHDDVVAALGAHGVANVSGAFGVAFVASLGTILREGVEVILILAILGAAIRRAGNPTGARRALWTGVAAAVLASAVTAIGLSHVIGAAQNQTRELIEGVVMLAAAGVLFYVSYWLIAQSESQRWVEFLKQTARRGAEGRRFALLGLAAFLAVYREGAEVVLMYQGLLTGQTARGLSGVWSGLAAGLAFLVVIALVVRYTSLRIPIRPFFQITGCLLFALAVVFAGNGVLELQSARVLKATGVPWLGSGVPILGVHPTLQGVAVQGILLLGAAFSLWFLFAQSSRSKIPSRRECSAQPARAASAPLASDGNPHEPAGRPVESRAGLR